jgi:threonine/homoserine/homoserine lactone efflux protein
MTGGMAIKPFLFGLTLAFSIGPIALLIISTGIRFGLLAGIRSGLGAAVADLVYAVVALMAGASLTPVLAGHRGLVRVVASVVLIGLGLRMLMGAVLAKAPDGATARVIDPGRPFLMTFGLTILNPLTILVFVGFAGPLGARLDAGGAVVCAVALFLGSLLVQLLLSVGGSALSRWLHEERWLRGLNMASATGILAFGLSGLLRL